MRWLLPLLLAFSLSAQKAEALLSKMSVEEKAGQLLMAWILSQEEGQEEARHKLRSLVRQGRVGGVILSTGKRQEAKKLIAELQGLAPCPLLVACDFETGLSARLQDSPHLGNAMLLGATGLPRLAREVGRATAAMGRPLGFHLALAPVLDVNVNPKNPIINLRSLGEDPRAVARMGAALILGLQEGGMLATAKHFPGHGDVATDSHLALPQVPGDRSRLEEVEFLPFVAAIKAGVAAIMTGHLSVPGLGEKPEVPATLSRLILTGILRREMGFQGLVVTDALDMGGVLEQKGRAHVAVRALAAGADLLLKPRDVNEAWDAVVKAVKEDGISLARLDDAALRLLRCKEKLGLFAEPMKVSPLGDYTDLGKEIARRGLTLVRDEAGLLPLCQQKELLVLSLLGEKGKGGRELVERLLEAQRKLSYHRLLPNSGAGHYKMAIRDARKAPLLLVTVHGAGSEMLQKVRELVEGQPRAVVIAFGNPYLLQQLPKIKTCLCAYDEGPLIERAVVCALLGKAPITGRLPVSIPGIGKLGDGLSLYSGLADARPEEEGMPADLVGRLRKLLEQKVKEGAFPGAVAMVTRRGKVLARLAVGRETYAADAKKLTTKSLFDLASLTKVCATLPACLRLMAAGKLFPDQKVQAILPAFVGQDKEKVTIRHLMTHCSGLPGYIRFFLEKKGKAVIVGAAASTELEYAPGTKTVYSDLGLMLLMACVEKVSGKSLDDLVKTEVFGPLGMSGARFGRTGQPLAAVPTEDCVWRHRVMRGEVHDENAYAMGGVSGHAGLFATAEDVARLGNTFLGGGGGWVPATLLRQVVCRVGMVKGSSRALLFDTFVVGKSGGTLLSPAAFGHTGYTGTSIWCDSPLDLCMVLLTNRVHPSRKNRKISQVRREFHDLVVGSLAENP